MTSKAPPSKPPRFKHSNYYAKPFEKTRRCYLFPKKLGSACDFSSMAARKKRGFERFDILGDWEKIAGAELAPFCQPIKLTGFGSKYGGRLHVRTQAAFALELQYQEPLILERLSLYYGQRLAEKIVILQ